MHSQKVVLWSIIGLVAFAILGAMVFLGGQRPAEREVPLLHERRFYQSGDEALINAARDAVAEQFNLSPESVTSERTPVVLRMQKMNCVKFDLNPPGIGRDYSVCLDAVDGSIVDYRPLDE